MPIRRQALRWWDSLHKALARLASIVGVRPSWARAGERIVVFFSFDGVDGAGKSTQIKLLRQWFLERGERVTTCRDPGSTALGEKLRGLLLEHHDTPIHLRSEMMLYMAARTQLVEEIIRPALAAGEVVISDRFLLANVVYQGHAGALAPEAVWQVGRVAVDGLQPDLTLVLDMPAAEAARRQNRPPDRMESRGESYLERVRQGFLTEASQNTASIRVLDARRPVEAVFAEVLSIVVARFPQLDTALGGPG